MASPISAAGAYAAIARITANPTQALAAAVDPKSTTSFTSVLKEANPMRRPVPWPTANPTWWTW